MQSNCTELGAQNLRYYRTVYLYKCLIPVVVDERDAGEQAGDSGEAIEDSEATQPPPHAVQTIPITNPLP